MSEHKVSINILYEYIIRQIDLLLWNNPRAKTDLILKIQELTSRLLDGEGHGEENEVNSIKSK